MTGCAISREISGINRASRLCCGAWIRNPRSPLMNPIAPAAVPPLPAWVMPRGGDLGEADAAFTAGIALKSLDDLVRTEPDWADCWR